jgi:hypothetical protein
MFNLYLMNTDFQRNVPFYNITPHLQVQKAVDDVAKSVFLPVNCIRQEKLEQICAPKSGLHTQKQVY